MCIVKKVSIQFHALSSECASFSDEWIDRHGLRAAVIQYFPVFVAREVNSRSEILDEVNCIGDGSYRVIALALTELDLSAGSPTDFAEKNPNALLLHLGQEDESCLREDWLVTSLGLESAEASRCWQSVSRDLKKRSASGAWAENPKTGGRSFYKNHRYTEGAREAQARGVVLCPASGDVRYDVLSDAPA